MKNTLTKAQLVQNIYSNTGIPHKDVRTVVDDLMHSIVSELDGDNTVQITSFGTFSVRHKAERIGRNPKTKERAVISARRAVSFRVSKDLKNTLENS